MYDSNLMTPPPMMPEKQKVPVLGIISCVLAVIAVLLFCGIFIWTFTAGSGSQFDPARMSYQDLTNLGLGIMALGCGSGLAALFGVVLGIIAVIQKDVSKVWGIIGLCLNGLIMLGYCGLFGLGALAG